MHRFPSHARTHSDPAGFRASTFAAPGFSHHAAVGALSMQVDNDSMIKALGAIRDAEDFAHLRGAFADALALLGIEGAYFVAPLTRDARIEPVLFTVGLPKVAERHYRTRLRHADPLPLRSTRFGNAFYWPDDIRADELSKNERRYTKIAAWYGLERGIGVACYGPQGRTGFLGAGWPGAKRPPDHTLLAVHQIGQTGFHRYCQLFSQAIDITPLSQRELEVLGWMCSGKSNPEMARIIGVSRSSIDAYIRRIFAKLGVSDRTAACVRAQSLGLVASEELLRLTEEAKRRDEPSD